MTKQLYLIDYECSQWCGGQSNVVVWAESAGAAILKASDYMEEAMLELFSTEFQELEEEEGVEFEDSAVSINSVEKFDPQHDEWGFFQDPTQSEFYPIIGKPD